MIFERLESFFRVPFIYLFLNSFIYSFVAIYLSSIIFKANVGLVSVFVISIALIPLINKILGMTFEVAGRKKEIMRDNVYLTEISVAEHKLSIWRLLGDYRELFQTYTAVFLGVFLSFALISVFLPAELAGFLLGDQIKVLSGNSFNMGFFTTLVVNNLAVMLIAFGFSAIFQLGTTFIIVWNASAWGTIFALYAKKIAAATASEPALSLLILLAIVFPHTILEASSYFSAAIAGGVTHRAIGIEQIGGRRSAQILKHAAFLLVFALFFMLLGALVETFVAPVAYAKMH